MAGMSCLFIALVAVFFAFVGTIVAVVTNRWYIVTLPNSETQFGLWRTCVDGNCYEYNFGALSIDVAASCTRTSSEMSSRWSAVQALTCIGAAFLFFSFLFLLGARFMRNKIVWAVAMFLLLLGTVLVGAGVAVWVATLQYWLWCGKSYCDFYSGTLAACDNSFGYSMIFGCLAFGMGVIGAIFALCSLGQSTKEDDQASRYQEAQYNQVGPNESQYATSPLRNEGALGTSTMVQSSSTPATRSRQPEQQQQQPQQQSSSTAASPEKELPEGDWAYDEESGLYWSEAEQLYLDRQTEQYYDPFSQQWYDPYANRWYTQ